jgi:hypothetical protein
LAGLVESGNVMLKVRRALRNNSGNSSGRQEEKEKENEEENEDEDEEEKKDKKDNTDMQRNARTTQPCSPLDLDVTVWSERADRLIEAAHRETLVNRYCGEEITLLLRERRYQRGVTSLGTLLTELVETLVHASRDDNLHVTQQKQKEAMGEKVGGKMGEKMGENMDENAGLEKRSSSSSSSLPKRKFKSKRSRKNDQRGTFVESLESTKQSLKQLQRHHPPTSAASSSSSSSSSPSSSSSSPSSSPTSPTSSTSNDNKDSTTFEMLLASLQMDFGFESVHVRTVIQIAEWAHSLSLSLFARDYKHAQVVVDCFTVLNR